MAPAPEGLHRAHAVAAAAAQEWNSDLTIILSSVDEAMAALELGNPAVAFLIDIRYAAQRCAMNAGILLDYGASRGLRATTTACQILARR